MKFAGILLLLNVIFLAACGDILTRCPAIGTNIATTQYVKRSRVLCYYVYGDLTCPDFNGWTKNQRNNVASSNTNNTLNRTIGTWCEYSRQ